jgi:hypothetical protein
MHTIEKCNCGKVKVRDEWVAPLDFLKKIIQLRNEGKIENIDVVDLKCDECSLEMKHFEEVTNGNHD